MDNLYWLVVLSVASNVAGSIVYIKDTLQGKTQPNRVSWAMWALAPLTGWAAAIAAQADFWVTVPVFMAGFLPFFVFLSSFINAKSYWDLSLFDILCGVCSILALAVWLLMGSPQGAILLAVVGDAFALLPTLRKSWYFPETESGITYIGGLLSVVLVLPLIKVWNIEHSAFQLYLLLANASLVFAIYRKRRGAGVNNKNDASLVLPDPTLSGAHRAQRIK